MSYIIGTGWWCDGSTKKSPLHGEERVVDRMQVFNVWLASIKKYTNPDSIVVVDSASPAKPRFSKSGMMVIPMTGNLYGPDFGLKNGVATRQVFLGAFYALFNKADYYVWVEQDCLLCGEGIIERAIREMRDADYSAGLWNHPYKIETCFMIFRCSSVGKIFSKYFSEKSNAPELRYWEMTKCLNFAPISFGYGRNRPICWEDEHFFAQQISQAEMDRFWGLL